MSKHNEDWIGKVREELVNYEPEYNAAHWKALQKSMPARPIKGGKKGFRFNALNSIITVAGIAILTVGIILWKQKNEAQHEIPTHTEEVVKPNERGVSTSAGTPLLSNQERKEEKVLSEKKVITDKPVSKGNKENLVAKSNTKTFIEHSSGSKKNIEKIEVKNQSQKTSENSKNPKYISRTSSASNNSIKQTVKVEDSEEIKKQSANATNNTIENKVNQQEKPISKEKQKADKAKKKKLKKSKSKAKNKSKGLKNNFQKNGGNGSPFYIGLIGTYDYYWKSSPFPGKLSPSAGLSFKKDITLKSRIELGIKLANLKYNYNEVSLKKDSTKITETVEIDSVQTVVERYEYFDTEILTPHSRNLLYVDIPLSYSYLFNQWYNSRAGISLGVSNKYLLNYKEDGEKVTLDQKFYWAQAGIIRFDYYRELTDRLHLQLSPYVEIPFRKTTNNGLNGIRTGVSLQLFLHSNPLK